MRTKLTLNIRKSIATTAKRYSRRKGKSISELFEELFEKVETGATKSDTKHAAIRLLQRLKKSKSIPTKNDELLLKTHVARKFA